MEIHVMAHVMHVNIEMNAKNTTEHAKETVKNAFIGQVAVKLKNFLNFLLTFFNYYDIIKM